MVSLRDLLLKRLAPDDQPLFRSGLQLGDAISKLEPKSENRYWGSPKTATSLINAALRGGKGRLPHALRLLIKVAVKQRLEPYPDLVDSWCDEVDKAALELRPSYARNVETPNASQAMNSLLALAGESQEHLYFQPGLSKRPDLIPDPLRSMVVASLGLSADAASTALWKDESIPHASYTVIVDSVDYARQAWIQLFHEITGTSRQVDNPLAPAIAAERLRLLSDSRTLRVIAVSPDRCVVPMAIFDASKWKESAGFLFFGHDDLSAAHEMPPEYVENWRASFYTKLSFNDTAFQELVAWDTSAADVLIAEANRRLRIRRTR